MAALLCRGVAALAALASLAAAGGNPFKDQKFYINPVNKKEYDSSIKRTSGKVKETLEEMRKVPSAYWIDVKSKTKGTGTRSVPGILKDAASKSPAELVVLIWYDLPNRDCDAKASNGEICCTANSDGTCDYGEVSDCADGIKDYEENYVEPFIAALKHYKGKVPVVIIVEPDSLPNLASNADHPHCGNPATKKAYTTCYKNAVERLAGETDASIYLDAAHGGWLGWDDNMRDFLKILDSMSLPLDRVRGFATNVANYQSLGHACPFKADQGYRNAFCLNGMHKSHKCCADPCDLLGEYNPGNGELNYAQDLIKAAKGDLSWDARVVIDTGRAGVADMRQSCKNWCNPRGSGAGPRSTTDVCMPDMVDAYFWLKTPGESDGCTQELPGGGQCKRFDTMCGSIDSIGMTSGEPKSPEAGAWFEYQVEMLAENAHLDNFPCPSPSDLEPEEEETGGQSTWGSGNSQNSNNQNNNQQQQQQQPQPQNYGGGYQGGAGMMLQARGTQPGAGMQQQHQPQSFGGSYQGFRNNSAGVGDEGYPCQNDFGDGHLSGMAPQQGMAGGYGYGGAAAESPMGHRASAPAAMGRGGVGLGNLGYGDARDRGHSNFGYMGNADDGGGDWGEGNYYTDTPGGDGGYGAQQGGGDSYGYQEGYGDQDARSQQQWCKGGGDTYGYPDNSYSEQDVRSQQQWRKGGSTPSGSGKGGGGAAASGKGSKKGGGKGKGGGRGGLGKDRGDDGQKSSFLSQFDRPVKKEEEDWAAIGRMRAAA